MCDSENEIKNPPILLLPKVNRKKYLKFPSSFIKPWFSDIFMFCQCKLVQQ